MMPTLLPLLFVAAYLAIALEGPLKINKSATALLGAGVLWIVYGLLAGDAARVNLQLSESLVGTAQIVFFLIAAMAIVEVIDAHDGFELLTTAIQTRRLSTLMWLVGLFTFFLSSILDNLTTTIVMLSLMKRLLGDRQDRLTFAGLIVIAANAGGAWSPIGDVTTTMLWIGGQVTSLAIMQSVFLASIVNLLVPLSAAAWMAGTRSVVAPPKADAGDALPTSPLERTVVLSLGLASMVLVPAFKSLTHLPPFMGLLLGLGLLWLVADLLHRRKDDDHKRHLTLVSALARIDMGSIVFFIGILLAVAALEHGHVLASLARWLEATVGRLDLIVLAIGLASAVVDNVPLVAASMGMYDLAQYPADHFLWAFMAYCAGTGGSILIIGSASGVAAMGLERIDFMDYLRKTSGLALAGYLAGALVYLVQYRCLH
ncbi:MAG: sodium:proton antiporter NhaD [Rhodoferax sp.]